MTPKIRHENFISSPVMDGGARRRRPAAADERLPTLNYSKRSGALTWDVHSFGGIRQAKSRKLYDFIMRCFGNHFGVLPLGNQLERVGNI